MQSSQIDKIIGKIADFSSQEYIYFDLKDKYVEEQTYQPADLGRFIDHLIEKGGKINMALLKDHIDKQHFQELIEKANFPIVVFCQKESNDIRPQVIYNEQKGGIKCYDFKSESYFDVKDIDPDTLRVYEDAVDPLLNGKIVFIKAFPLKYIVSDYYEETLDGKKKPGPVKRLFRLLKADRKDIVYIYIYAFVVGLISLSLPLGIQATISLISGGMVFSSVVVMIALVILGILIGGILQIIQITIVEVLRQRIFAKAAFEIAFRIPRIKMEAFNKHYPPELMNRFFDVVTIQKGLPKLFVDITGSLLQIFFGLVLLSLYHPFFLLFSIFLVTVITAIFYVTGPKGLKTSIITSKYKYKIAYWLEELARTVGAFKQAGTTNLPLQKMDELVNNYLFYRNAHFRVLITQFANAVAFKTLVVGGLLIIGTILVVDRQITLGQFVASEIIIILIVNSVEKLIISMDVVYDVLTGVDKVAHITDLPIESNSGLKINLHDSPKGLDLYAEELKYKYPGNSEHTLKGVSFDIKAGESVCIAGSNDSGKNTLMKVVTGFLESYEGIVKINQISLRDLHLGSLRDSINKDLSEDDIFDGSLLDNITMGRSHVHYKDVLWAIENVGLGDFVASLDDGLYTKVGATGKKLSGGVIARIILARSVASRPQLLIINDFSEHIQKREKLKLLSFLQDKSNGWTLLILSISDDSLLLSSCDKILLMDKGKVAAQGKYEELLANKQFQKLMFKGR